MGGPRTRQRRRVAAWLCLTALTASVVVLPGLHAALHLAERLAAERATPSGSRIIVYAHGHCHGGYCHGGPDDSGGSETPWPQDPVHHHHHDGDAPGEHGTNSPEHLAALLAPASAPVVPPRVEPATVTDYAYAIRLARSLPARRPAIRGPPAARS
ncbi:MAG TPA: hypothetical protein VHE35_03705 [Kofleriaceae bacterium]|nr:hypothetical protein [Kofleriaceae bacterium]